MFYTTNTITIMPFHINFFIAEFQWNPAGLFHGEPDESWPDPLRGPVPIKLFTAVIYGFLK
jgi:hypothetical protein